MTDKELIKEEIERRIKETYSTEGAIALKSLLDYINSISEEPVSEDLEEEIKSWIPAHIIGGDEYLRAVSTQWSEIVARHFAEWQKQESMQYLMEKAEEFLYLQLNNGLIECGNIERLIDDFKNYMSDEM